MYTIRHFWPSWNRTNTDPYYSTIIISNIQLTYFPIQSYKVKIIIFLLLNTVCEILSCSYVYIILWVIFY